MEAVGLSRRIFGSISRVISITIHVLFISTRAKERHTFLSIVFESLVLVIQFVNEPKFGAHDLNHGLRDRMN